jgi:hypothetical protein
MVGIVVEAGLDQLVGASRPRFRINKFNKGHMHHFDAEAGASPFQKMYYNNGGHRCRGRTGPDGRGI